MKDSNGKKAKEKSRDSEQVLSLIQSSSSALSDDNEQGAEIERIEARLRGLEQRGGTQRRGGCQWKNCSFEEVTTNFSFEHCDPLSPLMVFSLSHYS